MQPIKIIVSGAYAAEKRSFIRAVSDTEVVSTEAMVSLERARALAGHPTVALDLGTIAISAEATLFLLGTPGQERFDYMWESLNLDSIGAIFLVDSCRPAQLAEVRRIIERFSTLSAAPFVVAADKQDDPTALPPAYIRRRLGLPPDIPLIPCATTRRDDAKQVLLALLEQIDTLEQREEAA